MREALAERLLAQVMQWTPENVASERPLLQAMAAFKYDEYQQFAPGMRFIESFALWLNQFLTKEERDCAYNFIKEKLIFFSNAEIIHFISTAYHDHIRPILIQRSGSIVSTPKWKIHNIIKSIEFQSLRRRCLFLGLSDGARIDIFRRSNPELSHEQIWQAYELSPEKAKGIKTELVKDLSNIAQGNTPQEDTYFRMIFLIDDFSGSGFSYLRKSNSDDKYSGKIANFFEQLTGDKTGLSSLVDLDDLYIGVIFYIATDKTKAHLESTLPNLFRGRKIEYGIQIVQLLTDEACLQEPRDNDFLSLINNYYDLNAEDEHTKKGGDDVKLGFAGCKLPVALSHNTPNNSFFLLWANKVQHKYRGLFPRISRHRSEV